MAKRVNDQQREDVLRLHFIDRLSSRGIAAQLGMARRTVRHIIQGRRPSEARPAVKRETELGLYQDAIKKELAETPAMNAPAMLERLRVLGYAGGISVLRARLRVLRLVRISRSFRTSRRGPPSASKWTGRSWAMCSRES